MSKAPFDVEALKIVKLALDGMSLTNGYSPDVLSSQRDGAYGGFHDALERTLAAFFGPVRVAHFIDFYSATGELPSWFKDVCDKIDVKVIAHGNYEVEFKI